MRAPIGEKKKQISDNVSAHAKLRRGLLISLLIIAYLDYITNFPMSSAQFG